MLDPLFDWLRFEPPLAHAATLLAAGLVLLVAGAELFVAAAVRLSIRFGLSRMTIGLTIVAVGTSLPELGASLVAVLKGADAVPLALGNALGSNVANIGLLLGLAALVRPLETGHTRHWRHLLVMCAAAGGFAVVAYTSGTLHRIEAGVALVVFLGYIGLLFRPRVAAYPGTDDLEREEVRGSLGGDAFLFLAGAILVWAGSEILVRGALDLADRLEVTSGVIGAAVVAVGTSLPELAVCFSAARRREGGILLGNLIGSNIANLLLVLGVVALVRPLAVGQDALVIYTPAMLVFTVLMTMMVALGKRVSRMEGAILLVLYVAFQGWVWTR